MQNSQKNPLEGYFSPPHNIERVDISETIFAFTEDETTERRLTEYKGKDKIVSIKEVDLEEGGTK